MRSPEYLKVDRRKKVKSIGLLIFPWLIDADFEFDLENNLQNCFQMNSIFFNGVFLTTDYKDREILRSKICFQESS